MSRRALHLQWTTSRTSKLMGGLSMYSSLGVVKSMLTPYSLHSARLYT